MQRPKRIWALLAAIVIVAYIPTLMLHQPQALTYSVMLAIIALAWFVSSP